MTKKIKFFGFAALALTAALTTSCQSDENVNVEEKMVAMDVELSSLTTTETDSPLTRASVEKRKIQYFFCDANNNILTTDSKDGVPYAGFINEGEGFKVYLPAGKNVVAKFAHMSSYDEKEDFEFDSNFMSNSLQVYNSEVFYSKNLISVPETTKGYKFSLDRLSAKFVAEVGDIPAGTRMKIEVKTRSNVFHWLKQGWNLGGPSNSYANFVTGDKGKTLEQFTMGYDKMLEDKPNANDEANFFVTVSMYNTTGNINGQSALLTKTFEYAVDANKVKTVTYSFSGDLAEVGINDTPMVDVDGGSEQEF